MSPAPQERVARSIGDFIRALRLESATQGHLFCADRRQQFEWEHTLLQVNSATEENHKMKQAAGPTLYRQGDVLFKLVDQLPGGDRKTRGNGVIALGDVTGHSHAVADLEAAEVIEIGNGLYVHVGEDGVSIQHQEHGAIELPAGDYEVTIQREYTPEAIRNVVD